MAKNQTAASRAFQIRNKLKKGKYVSPAEKEWFDNYSKIVEAKKVNSLPPLPAMPKQEEFKVDKDRFIGEPKLEPFHAPLPEGEEPAPQDASAPIEPEVVKEGEKDFPGFTESPKTEGQQKKEPSQDAKQTGAKGALAFCKWLKRTGKECEAMGGIAIPEELVDGLIGPCAQSSFTRVAAIMDDALSDNAQDAIVIASAGTMFIQRHMLMRKRRENGETEAPTQEPKNGVKKETPSKKEESKTPVFGKMLSASF